VLVANDAESDTRGHVYSNAVVGQKVTRGKDEKRETNNKLHIPYVVKVERNHPEGTRHATQMSRHLVGLPDLRLDPAAPHPLHHQLYDGLRTAILSGRLAAGARLPSTRALADELDVSRNTVLDAYAQLLAEGYAEGKVGSGTYVSRALPDDLLHVHADRFALPATSERRGPSRRGALLAATPVSTAREYGRPRAFGPGLAAFDTFPFEIWARLMLRRWRRPPPELLSYGDPAGYRPLREAIAAYLNAARGVRCTAEQVIVVAGSQQGLDLAARVLLDPGDPAWIEDPGYMGARGALGSAGARLVPVPVDAEGIDVAAGVERCAEARMAYVTPSHQFPLGVTMSLPRRLALLEWARRAGAWLLEDDYDSEYRYAGRPLPALQGLDGEGRTVYLGTFSKVLFPSLRLGYMVVPSDLLDAFVSARALADRHGPSVEQATLADFIVEGHFARHIRRTRALYAARRAALMEAARHELAGLLDLAASDAGMHLVGWLPTGVDDRVASRRAAARGVDAPPLSAYAIGPLARGGLLLGYAAVDEREIREGVERLAAALV
jgi:GntR family transcriptional regulator / MocR family aminotransferase